jgi:hypothetical protein
VDIALAQNRVFLGLQLNLEAIFRIKQNLVPHLDGSNVRTHGHRFGPSKAPRHLGSRRNQDPRARASLTLRCGLLHEDPIEKNGDWLAISASGYLCFGHPVTVPHRESVQPTSRRADGETRIRHVCLCLTDGVFAEMEDRCSENGISAPKGHSFNQMLKSANSTRSNQRDTDCVAHGSIEFVIESLSGSVTIHRRHQDLSGTTLGYFSCPGNRFSIR